MATDWPLLLLCILPLAVAFGSLVALTIHGLHAGPTDLLVGALTLLVFGSQLIRHRPQIRAYFWGTLWRPGGLGASLRDLRGWLARLRRREPQTLALLATLAAYLFVIALSYTVATSHSSVIKEVLKWGEVIAVVALTLTLARTERQVRLIVWALILAGLAEALLGCAQWALSAGALGPGGASIRVFGTFDQPNPYGGYLNFALPLALAITLFGRDTRERWAAGAASVVLLMAQAFADSRGAELGLAAAVVVIVVVGLRRERLAGLIALIGAPLLAIAWFAHLIPHRIENALLDQARVNGTTLNCSPNSGVNDANFSTVERLAHWVAGIRMFLAHPLLGVGAGNYNAAYARYAVPCWPEPLGHAHNYYINAAAETGSLGLLAFLALVAAALYLGWRATHPTHPTSSHAQITAQITAHSRALALGLFAVIVALCVHNLTDDLFVHAMELQFALSLGCLLTLARGRPAPQTTQGAHLTAAIVPPISPDETTPQMRPAL